MRELTYHCDRCKRPAERGMTLAPVHAWGPPFSLSTDQAVLMGSEERPAPVVSLRMLDLCAGCLRELRTFLGLPERDALVRPGSQERLDV